MTSGSGGSASGAGGAGSGGLVSSGGSAGVPVNCDMPAAPRAPLRRLTRFEYNNTLRDFLQIEDRPADALPGEELGNGFGNDADVLGVSRILIDGYRSVAQDIANSLAADAVSAQALAGCDPLALGEEACGQQFIARFGEEALRKPLDAEETAVLASALAKGRELGGDFASGIRAVVEVTLQLPQFLYRLERGEVADAALGLGRPTSFEMASRLSYLLWASLPDAELVEAARRNELLTPEQVFAQATRMLEDDRSREVTRFFHGQLYGLGGLDTLARSPEYYPTFIPGMGTLFRQETERFVEHVIWELGGDFQTLMSAPFSVMNQPLAEFYGVTGVASGDAFQRVELDPTRRAGVLTQASIMSLTTPGSRTNPIVRSKWVLQKFLCQKIPNPPVGLMVEEPEVVPGLSTRERFTAHREDPTCATCHDLLDPVGFGLENYDGVGLWRDMDNGVPIDASGELPMSDAAGPFSGPVELAQRMAQSLEAQSCYVGSWLTYAYGRTETTQDACTRASLERAFAEVGGNVKALLLALTQTDAFLYRPLPSSM